MDFSALVFVDVFLVFAVAEINLRPVPEANFILDNRSPTLCDPTSQHRAEALWTFHVVLVQIVPDTPEQIDLQPWDSRAPHDRGDTHKMRFPASSCPAVQTLRRLGLERLPLPRMQMKVQGVR